MQETKGTCFWGWRNLRAVALVAIAIVLTASAGWSQAAGTGSIQGTVSDPSGAVIPNAEVTLTDTATQVSHKTTSSTGGIFSFPNLEVGDYSLTVTAAGFKQYTRTHIILEVGSSIGVNVTMSVGAATQRVEVQANGIALQTQDTSFKQTIDSKTITELPLNGRQMTSLITLSGGAAPAPGNDMVGSKSFYSSVAISIAGGMGNATDYRLDGGDNNDYMTNVNLPFPFPDAVGQFSVETTALGAQSGLHPGGLVNVVTRSGTNKFHGDAFEFIRNNIINATNFFSSTPDSLHQNQFGGTLGGPVLRDKLFFFAGYQRLISNSSQANKQAYVPTAANLAGDFSVTDGATCTASGKFVQLLNPQTGAVLTNDQISPSTFSSASLALLKYLPQTSDPCGLVSYTIPSQQRENQFVTRVDATLTPRNNLYGRYFLDGYSSPSYFYPNNALVTTQAGNYERAQSLTIGENFVLSSRTVNSLHATADRRRDNRGPSGTGINPSTIGVDIYNPIPDFLELTLTNKWSTYCGTCAPAKFNVNTFSVADDVNLVRGRQQIAFGGEYVRSQFNANNAYETNGNFGFTGVYSQKGPAGTSKGGTGADANLDFLTGSLNTFQQSKSQQNALRAPIPTLYVQDTWQATPKLVLTAGVRWDPEYMPTDYFGRGAIFNYSDFVNNVHSTVFPGAPAGAFFYGDKGVPKNFTQNSPLQFSPRLGITWNPDGSGKTVFRAGGALMYDEPNFFTAQRVQQNPPFATAISNVPGTAPLSFASPWTGGSTPANPFPQPFHPPSNTVFPNQAQYIVMPHHFHPPYVLQWTASVQHELGRGWEVQLDYIGNETSFQTWGYPLNAAVYIPGTCGSGPCSTLGNTSTRYALTLANPTQGPKYAGGGGGSVLIDDTATASYNGLIATVQHRVSTNFTLLSNYTWSHCIDVEDAQGDFAGTTVENPNNPRMDRSNCGFDYRHIFNTSMVITSHFSGLHGITAAIANNWELAPLLHVTDGIPFTVVSGVDNSLTAVNNDRPNRVAGVAVYTGKKITKTNAGNRLYVNPAAFAQNATGTYGDVGRNSLRSPTQLQFDSELSRFFPLNERTKLDFRIEAFNVLNHPEFSTPNTSSLISSNFGQITATTTGSTARVFQGAIKVIF